MWKGLSVISDSPSPIVVVLSGSMEPAFQRGDLLVLWNRNLVKETEVGEVVVYNVKGKDIPIVHRVVRKFGTGYVLSFICSTRTTLIFDPRQLQGEASHKGRQQRGGRYRPVRTWTGPPGARRHYWQRGRLRAICRICHHYAVRAPVDEDGHAGYNGFIGRVTTRVVVGGSMVNKNVWHNRRHNIRPEFGLHTSN